MLSMWYKNDESQKYKSGLNVIQICFFNFVYNINNL